MGEGSKRGASAAAPRPPSPDSAAARLQQRGVRQQRLQVAGVPEQLRDHARGAGLRAHVLLVQVLPGGGGLAGLVGFWVSKEFWRWLLGF